MQLVLTLLACVQASAPERAFVEWAAETAVPIDLEAGLDPALLAPLVERARVVYLGEPDHFIAEKYAFRLAFLEALHALGWRHLGMEMGHSDGQRYDRYLETGDEASLLDVGLYGSVGDVDAAIESGGFLGAEMSYARRLRAIGAEGAGYRYFGFDLDMRPGNGLGDALAHIEGLAPAEELARAISDAAAGAKPGEALEALAREVDDPDGRWSGILGERRSALALDLFVYAESLTFRASGPPSDSDIDTALAPFRRRERAMFRIFDETLAGLGPDAKVALTGHNMHLSVDYDGARWVESGGDFPVPLWPTIGAHVAERLPGQVVSIWLIYDHGERLPSPLGADTQAVASVTGTLESLLAELPHESFLLPLASADPRSAWLDDERTFRVNGGVGWGHLRRLADAVVFAREAHAP